MQKKQRKSEVVDGYVLKSFSARTLVSLSDGDTSEARINNIVAVATTCIYEEDGVTLAFPTRESVVDDDELDISWLSQLVGVCMKLSTGDSEKK